MGDALKSQKKGLKLDVTRIGYTMVYVSAHYILENTESLCVVETICETGPVGKWIGKSLRGSNSTQPCVPTWTHSETN